MNDNEIKVSQLNEATELNDNDIFMVVQEGINKKIKSKKIGGNEVLISDDPTEITNQTKLYIDTDTGTATYKDGEAWIPLKDNEVIISDTQPTDTDNEIWIDTSENATYINQEVNIGATNPSNTPVWFKQGKNLFSSKLELGTYSNEGAKSGSTTNYRSVTMVAVQPNTTYTFSINGVSQKYVIYYYNSLMTFISAEGLTTGTFTTPANCCYINFRCFNADFTSDYANLKLQIEEGNTATAYEPYITPRININGENLFYANDYSTTEQVVGRWIDGRILYRKVIVYHPNEIIGSANTTTNINIPHGISNFRRIVKKSMVDETGITFPTMTSSNGTNITASSTLLKVDSSNITFRIINDTWGPRDFYIILEYTKTTD